MKRSPLRLFLTYMLCFVLALVLAYIILTRIAEGLRDGQFVLLLLPPLGGMAVFHGLFPLLSRIRLGTNFLTYGGGLVFGVGALVAAGSYLSLLDPSAALVIWLVGVFGPGWWLISQYAEKNGYYS
ncbi:MULTISPECIES: hypothetical protein [Roseinatronobacter]|uniref:Uncharacterized protein n=1 Tax=Roseinatronobacter domitianus TaxID=2940293 RepID=A0ABT0LZG7_9RHOB|nr:MULTISPECIES: hypothetical protein [Roseibaca]MCL1627439.1 hypothetical protein [Roseibaca domitiana]